MKLTNQDLADTFDRIADLLEIKGEVIYKTLAYRKAAESLRNLAEDASALYEQKRLTDIPGVGKAISEKIGELLDTGELGFLKRLEEEVPPTLTELLQVPDVGPRKAALFWKQANVTSLAELEAAARQESCALCPAWAKNRNSGCWKGSKRSNGGPSAACWATCARWRCAHWNGCDPSRTWKRRKWREACAAGGLRSATWTWWQPRAARWK